jgi:hypothetical protein
MYGVGFRLYAAYPNPTSRAVNIKFYIPAADTVKLYFLNSVNDSDIFFSGPVMAGSYAIVINDSTNQYANSYRRLYFSSKRFSPSQYCRFYGDIKFEQ